MVHVSGEWWIAEMVSKATDEVVDVFRVGFEVGVDGKVKGAKMDLDRGIRDVAKWVWFEKDSRL